MSELRVENSFKEVHITHFSPKWNDLWSLPLSLSTHLQLLQLIATDTHNCSELQAFNLLLDHSVPQSTGGHFALL